MLAPLRSSTEFAGLAQQAQKLYPAVHKAKVAFTVPEKDLFPEGLAYDPAKRVFYMGSMHRRKVVRITEKGEVSDFVKPDFYHLQPIGGVHVDPADQSLWAASDADDAAGSERNFPTLIFVANVLNCQQMSGALPLKIREANSSFRTSQFTARGRKECSVRGVAFWLCFVCGLFVDSAGNRRILQSYLVEAV